MKNPLIVLVITALCFACNPEKVRMKTDLQTFNLKGNVWKIERTLHDTKVQCVCPAAQDDDCKQSLTVYNKSGNIEQLFEIDSDGDTIVRSVYTYNSDGMCKAIDRYRKNALTDREIPHYKKGRMAELDQMDKNGEVQVTYQYAYAGDQVSKIKELDSDGDIQGITENEYESGKLLSQTIRDNNGAVKSKVRYVRNNLNDVVESVFEIPGDTTLHKVTYEYEYDETGNWIKQIKYYRNEIANVVMRNIAYYE